MRPFNRVPEFRSVKEVYSAYPKRTAFIAIDPNAGRQAVYSVLVIDHELREVFIHGRELPLKQARSIAKAVQKSTAL